MPDPCNNPTRFRRQNPPSPAAHAEYPRIMRADTLKHARKPQTLHTDTTQILSNVQILRRWLPETAVQTGVCALSHSSRCCSTVFTHVALHARYSAMTGRVVSLFAVVFGSRSIRACNCSVRVIVARDVARVRVVRRDDAAFAYPLRAVSRDACALDCTPIWGCAIPCARGDSGLLIARSTCPGAMSARRGFGSTVGARIMLAGTVTRRSWSSVARSTRHPTPYLPYPISGSAALAGRPQEGSAGIARRSAHVVPLASPALTPVDFSRDGL